METTWYDHDITGLNYVNNNYYSGVEAVVAYQKIHQTLNNNTTATSNKFLAKITESMEVGVTGGKVNALQVACLEKKVD